MKLKTYPQIYFKDCNGKHFIRTVNWYGRVFEFMYDEDGDIVLKQKYFMEEYERMMKEESIEVAEIFDEMHKETPNEMK